MNPYFVCSQKEPRFPSWNLVWVSAALKGSMLAVVAGGRRAEVAEGSKVVVVAGSHRAAGEAS